MLELELLKNAKRASDNDGMEMSDDDDLEGEMEDEEGEESLEELAEEEEAAEEGGESY